MILLYIRDDIPADILSIHESVEVLYFEIKIRKKKWFMACTYNPLKNLISTYLKELGKNSELFSSTCENFIQLGDLNAEPTPNIKWFLSGL